MMHIRKKNFTPDPPLKICRAAGTGVICIQKLPHTCVQTHLRYEGIVLRYVC